LKDCVGCSIRDEIDSSLHCCDGNREKLLMNDNMKSVQLSKWKNNFTSWIWKASFSMMQSCPKPVVWMHRCLQVKKIHA